MAGPEQERRQVRSAMPVGCDISWPICARRWPRSRSISAGAKAGFLMMSAIRSSDAPRFERKAASDTEVRSIVAPVLICAPSRSRASAIWVESSVAVPSSSRSAIRLCRPRRSGLSAA